MKTLISPFLFLTLFAFVMSSCVSSPSPTSVPEVLPAQPTSLAPSEEEKRVMPLELTSTAFAPGEPIPRKYT